VRVTGRRFRLSPWLVRALIPDGVIGVYVLWSPTAPVYVGRSDTSLRRRLLEHARTWPDVFFTFDVAFSPEDAYRMECCLFHALADRTTNIDHPQRVTSDDAGCDICPNTLLPLLEYRRRQIDVTPNPPGTHRALQADMRGMTA
jgi:hypothetical protein